MTISVTEPISKALQRTGKVLFKPFDIGKWFLLGFCAFLARCGEQGGGFNFPNPGGGGGGRGGGPSTQQVQQWFTANLPWIIGIAAAILIVIVIISLLVLWLRSRGTFMFTDGIVRNRGAVSEPWRAFRHHGNSLFGFSILLTLTALLVYAAILGIGALIAWSDIKAQQWGAGAVSAIIICLLLFFMTGVFFAIVTFLLNDFVVPTMYLRGVNVMDGWSIVRQELLPGNVGVIVLFALMKILLGFVIGMMRVLGTCVTCCLPALPYLGDVILLPLSVFKRCYTLYFLEQFGPQWRFFRYDGGAICPVCGYDLRGAASAGICPECGTPYQEVSPLVAPPGAAF